MRRISELPTDQRVYRLTYRSLPYVDAQGHVYAPVTATVLVACPSAHAALRGFEKRYGGVELLHLDIVR